MNLSVGISRKLGFGKFRTDRKKQVREPIGGDLDRKKEIKKPIGWKWQKTRFLRGFGRIGKSKLDNLSDGLPQIAGKLAPGKLTNQEKSRN